MENSLKEQRQKDIYNLEREITKLISSRQLRKSSQKITPMDLGRKQQKPIIWNLILERVLDIAV